MRICFCDDEPAMRQLLEQMVRRWAQQTGTACELSCCASAEQMLFENQENFAFDLILLDIQMERMDGIQLAKTIRQRDQRVLIAFLTAVREHVFEGYEVQAVRYLLKPLQEEKLFELLQLAADRAREQRPYLILGPEGERRKVYLDALLSVEAQGHYLLLDTTGGKLEQKGSLAALLQRLDGSFVQTHRSFVVNLQHVVRITRTDCTLDNGSAVPVSRSAYRGLNEAFIRFYRQGIL